MLPPFYSRPLLYRSLETQSVNRTPTGTMIPTVLSFRAGTNIKSISIRIMGAIAIFQFFDTNTTPKAPNRAGRS